MKKLVKLLSLVLCAVLIMPSGAVSGSIVKAADQIPVMEGYIYHQTDARSMINMINDFRTSKPVDSDASTAWYWNADDTTRTKYNTTASNTLHKMEYDYDLEKIAMIRATEIIKVFDHNKRATELCAQYKVPFGGNWTGVGENIAYGYSSAKNVFVGWREDDDPYMKQGHRRNMLGSYTAVGIGCVEYNGTKYWVQVFSHEAANTTPTKAIDGMYNGSSSGDDTGSDDTENEWIGNKKSSKIAAVGETYSVASYFKKVKVDKYKITKGSATVKISGKVVPKKAGTIKVTGYKKYGSKYISVGSVTFTAINPKLKAMSKKLSVKTVDAREYLSNNKAKNKTVLPKSWTSSNKTVATINSKGVITLKKAGTTTITAYYGSGSNAAKITAKLTVKK